MLNGFEHNKFIKIVGKNWIIFLVIILITIVLITLVKLAQIEISTEKIKRRLQGIDYKQVKQISIYDSRNVKDEAQKPILIINKDDIGQMKEFVQIMKGLENYNPQTHPIIIKIFFVEVHLMDGKLISFKAELRKHEKNILFVCFVKKIRFGGLEYIGNAQSVELYKLFDSIIGLKKYQKGSMSMEHP